MGGSSEACGEATQGAAIRLAGYSFLILFFELALIRYVPAYVRVFGFYLNLVLIAAFLGMGVGLLRTDAARRVRWLALPALLLLFAAVKYFSNVLVRAPRDPDEHLWAVFLDIAPSVRRIGIFPVVAVLFALSSFLFVPLGALLGREFRKFPPLHAYSIDIAGSLLGILAFAAASHLRTPPVVWFTTGFAIWILLSLNEKRFGAALASVALAALALVAWTAGPKPEYWSPYYRINVLRHPNRYSINVNGSMHQWAVNLDTAVAARDQLVRAIRYDYLRPFQHVSRVDTAIVVGAGTGNDIVLLLEIGARHIDAVEIDPTILDLGRAIQFQEPYADPRVHAFVDDARAFFRKTDRRYDVIVFGTLDSQTLLSGMSSLRLDNYVYTVESFRSAREHLKPGGALVTYHMSGAPWIAQKIQRIIAEAFGEEPIVFYEPRHRLFNYTFVAGGRANPGPARNPPSTFRNDVPVPSDDWPYLYLSRHTVPGHYLRALAVILAFSLSLVGLAAGRTLRRGFDGAMFFMGVGFLLVETKSVTEMSLLFGSTWVVNLLVFSSILVMILLANLLVLKTAPRRPQPLFAALFVSLAAAYALPVRSLLWLGVVGQWIVGGLMVALPIFFAAMIFATLFRTRVDTTRALSYNLLGAVLGGTLEYSSMVVGIKALYLVAAVAYLSAFLYARRAAPARVRL